MVIAIPSVRAPTAHSQICARKTAVSFSSFMRKERSSRVTRRLFLLSSLLLCIPRAPPVAEATYSIVAVDSETRQVGGAGATCLEGSDVYDALYLSAPGRSVVMHTQGLLIAHEGPIGLAASESMRREGSSIDNVLTAMREVDDGKATYGDVEYAEVELRQYLIADSNATASYTGRNLSDVWTNLFGYSETEVTDVGKNGLDGRYNYHVAGNGLRMGTVAAVQGGFEERTDDDDFGFGLCDLAGKLMTAVYRVPDGNLGDLRCLGQDGRSASGAYLHVDNEDGSDFVHINMIDTGTKEPVEAMKELFLAWRKNNPCDGDSPNTAPAASTARKSAAGLSPAISAVSILLCTMLS